MAHIGSPGRRWERSIGKTGGPDLGVCLFDAGTPDDAGGSSPRHCSTAYWDRLGHETRLLECVISYLSCSRLCSCSHCFSQSTTPAGFFLDSYCRLAMGTERMDEHPFDSVCNSFCRSTQQPKQSSASSREPSSQERIVAVLGRLS